ncbi:MAG: type 4a pilus biogenesis protein PilO [Solirubrobacterales bacterium]
MKQRGPIIAGVAAAALALLLVVFLVLPKMGQVGEARDSLQTAQDSEISLQAQLRSLQDAQAQAPQTEDEIKALDDQVPSTVDLPGLFRLLQGAADRAAVDFFQFSPGTPAPDLSGGFSILSSQIVITGSYFTLQEFLYSMESLPRAAKVMSVAITPAGSTSGTTTTTTTSTGRLQMQLTVEFYTTDSSAGPGSSPGPTEGLTTVPAAASTTTTTESGA